MAIDYTEIQNPPQKWSQSRKLTLVLVEDSCVGSELVLSLSPVKQIEGDVVLEAVDSELLFLRIAGSEGSQDAHHM